MKLRIAFSALAVLVIVAEPAWAQSRPDLSGVDFSRKVSRSHNNAPPPVYTVGEPPPGTVLPENQGAGAATPPSTALPPAATGSASAEPASPAIPGSNWRSDFARGSHWQGSLVGQHTMGGGSAAGSYQPPSHYGQGSYGYGQAAPGSSAGASQWSQTSNPTGGSSTYSSRLLKDNKPSPVTPSTVAPAAGGKPPAAE